MGQTRGRAPGPPSSTSDWYWLSELFREHEIDLKLARAFRVKAWFRGKLRKKPKPIAQTLVAKELARIAYRVLVDECDFNGTFKGVPVEKIKTSQWPRRASPVV